MNAPDVATELTISAVVSTLQRSVSPDIGGVGLRTHPLRFDNLDIARSPRPAEEFLTASRLRRWDRETDLSINYYFSDTSMVVDSFIDSPTLTGHPSAEAGTVPLTEPGSIDVSLTEAVARRRSRRRFGGEQLRQADMSSLLSHAGSVTARAETDLLAGGSVELGQRAVPSAGGLFPVALWVAALNVEQLPRGVFRYRPNAGDLAPVAEAAPIDQLLQSFALQGDSLDINRAGAILLLVAQPWRSMRKYGARGLRFVLHEAGGISQNLHLAATGLHLASVDWSGFYDDEANAALGLDGTYGCLVHSIVVGSV